MRNFWLPFEYGMFQFRYGAVVRRRRLCMYWKCNIIGQTIEQAVSMRVRRWTMYRVLSVEIRAGKCVVDSEPKV